MQNDISLFEQAIAAELDSQWDKAVGLYRACLQADPHHLKAMERLSQLAFRSGLEDEGEILLYNLVMLNPGNLLAQARLGHYLFTKERYQEARPFLANAADAPGAMRITALAELGILLAREGQPALGRPLLESALEALPERTPWIWEYGNLLVQLNDLPRAALEYQKAYDQSPHPDLGLSLGLVWERLIQADRALAILNQNLQQFPDHWPTRRHCARILIESGKGAEGINLYHEPIASGQIPPADCDRDFGDFLIWHCDYSFAVECYQRLCTQHSDSSAIDRARWGNALLLSQELNQAQKVLEQALEQDADCAPARLDLAVVLVVVEDALRAYQLLFRQADRFDLAAAAAHQIAAIHNPELAIGWLNYWLERHPGTVSLAVAAGEIAIKHLLWDESVLALSQAIKWSSQQYDLWHDLSGSLHKLGRTMEAIQAAEQAMKLRPDLPTTYLQLARIYQDHARWEEALPLLEKAYQLAPDDADILSRLIFTKGHLVDWRNFAELTKNLIAILERSFAKQEPIKAEVFSLAALPIPRFLRAYVARQGRMANKQAVRKVAPRQHSKLRVGYLSPDFRRHSLGTAFASISQHHDRRDFDFFGLNAGSGTDSDRALFGLSNWVELDGLNQKERVTAIQELQLDLIVDLAGPTKNSCMELLCQGLAPITAHYMGYGDTTGQTYIDYLITDPINIPPDFSDHCVEKLVWLPTSFMAPTILSNRMEITNRAAHNLDDQAFVFANFNMRSKFHPDSFDDWMAILRDVPHGVLWLLDAPPKVQSQLRFEAKSRGVDGQRLVFAPKVSVEQHLTRLALADLGLDCLYHQGGATTLDALKAGVPVLSVLGEAQSMRTGASILTYAGLPECVLPTRQAMIDLAIEWGWSGDRTRNLKAELLQQQSKAQIFHPEILARSLEQAFRQMIERSRTGLAPTSFFVERTAL